MALATAEEILEYAEEGRRSRITVNSKVLARKSVIKGARIAVDIILELFANG